jgi:hypothetical protein
VRRSHKVAKKHVPVSQAHYAKDDDDDRLPAKEAALLKALRDFMHIRGWYTKKMHGSIYQAGFPDLFAAHPQHGIRLIETKTYRPGHGLEPSQVAEFTKLNAVYILRGPQDYERLFKPHFNWMPYAGGLKP